MFDLGRQGSAGAGGGVPVADGTAALLDVLRQVGVDPATLQGLDAPAIAQVLVDRGIELLQGGFGRIGAQWNGHDSGVLAQLQALMGQRDH